jgi:hypothetical protein
MFAAGPQQSRNPYQAGSSPRGRLIQITDRLLRGLRERDGRRIADADLKSMDGLPAADRIKRMQPVIDAVTPICTKGHRERSVEMKLVVAARGRIFAGDLHIRRKAA